MFHEFILCIVKNSTDQFWRHLVASFFSACCKFSEFKHASDHLVVTATCSEAF